MSDTEKNTTERRARASYVSLIWRVERSSKSVYLVAVCTCDREAHYVEAAGDLFPDNTIRAEQTPLNHLCGECDLLSVMNRRWRKESADGG